jgi:class 3 adenylate cyclase/tetratricopeptide (TPR) repeat protein
MRCGRCQQENPPGSNFCLGCGAALGLACANCGIQLPAEARFCNKCGTPTVAEIAAPPRFASPGSYTPKHLAEKILTSKAALEGERKQVTVLFADLKGSMELLADRDPEEARKLLDPVLERMMEAVHRYEGTVNQVMGDGIMALFGAPLAHEDHAVRACYAALRMQESVKRYAEGVRREHGITIRMRVGLNSGEVVVRAIGSDLHMDYTAVGQTTHLAARMEQLADPGSILLTPDTLTLVEGFVQVTPLGPMAVKGLPAPVEVYELAGVSAVRSRLQAAAARGLSRFVGRDAEIEHLRRALEQAGQGRGQIAAVVGEPGVGKSRLIFELTHSHRVEGWLVLESGSVSYGKATSYLPVIDLLRGYFRVGDRDTHRDIREKMTGKILTLDRALEPILSALLSLLDLPTDDLQWQGLDPPQRRQRTLDAIKRLLLRESRVQPLVMVFEDLHWVDTETQALLESLVESLPTARLLLLVNYRPEYSHGWGNKTYYMQLRLDALPPESAGELLEVLLGSDGALQPLKQVLAARTGGNPLFLEESVRTLVETGGLVGARGGYRLAKPLRDIHVPATVQAILAARIDRLPPEEKQLLQRAAVVGKDVPYALLAAIAEEPEERLRTLIAHLQAAEFLYETTLFPDLEYTFKHALTHEVTYGTLLQGRRKELHTGIVGAIEHFYPDRLTEHVERLAHHAVRGEVWEKAVTYLRQTGAKAFARSANREAVSCFEQALVALQHLPETGQTLEQAIDLRFDLSAALFPLGEFERRGAYLQEADRLARSSGDSRRAGWASVYMSHYCWISGQPTDARIFAERAQVIAEAANDIPQQVAANIYLGTVCHAISDYQRADQLFRINLQLLQGDMTRERFRLPAFPAVLSQSYLAYALAERGAFDEGIAHGRESVGTAERLNHPFTLVVAYYYLAYLYSIRGDCDPALHLLERALDIAQEWNLNIWLPLISGPLGYTLALSGRVSDGVLTLRRGAKDSENMAIGLHQSRLLAQLGEALLLASRLEEARASGSQALALARQRGERGYEGYALRLLGDVASLAEPVDAATAETRYWDALTLARELDMRPLVAHCHLGLGKLYRRTSKRPEAQEHLTTATTMYREMDMRFWLEKAEAEMKELA